MTKSSELERAYITGLVKHRLKYYGVSGSPRASKRLRQNELASFKKLSRMTAGGAFNVGQITEMEQEVTRRLVAKHGWVLVNNSAVPPANAARQERLVRESALNPHLLDRLREFRHMSPAYREAVAGGIFKRDIQASMAKLVAAEH